jgi:hypothetical protein
MSSLTGALGRSATSVSLVILVTSCASELGAPGGPPGPGLPPEGERVFFEDFQVGEAPRWEPVAGRWDVVDPMPGAPAREYAPDSRELALSLAGANSWSDYQVTARLLIEDDRAGDVGVIARAQRSHHYFELVLGRTGKGVKSWFIRQRVDHSFTILASGPVDFQPGVPYLLRFVLRGAELAGWLARDGGGFTHLGSATVAPGMWRHGKFGLASYSGNARFDDVTVTSDPAEGDVLAAELGPWGGVVELRDDTGTFPTGKPAGGWYVTPIHATVRASDGKVLITGFGRKAEASCTGSTQRETGTTWLLDPSAIDALDDGQTLFVTPINEQNLDTSRHVLYCAGHNTLSDGRIFFSAGTDYPEMLPDSSPERGLTYSRVYNPAVGASGSFTRISTAMTGGQSVSRGEKWYPTNLLLPDGRVLIFGGFHWSGGGPGVKPNYSLELFDPAIWDANPNANPYTVLTQHEEGSTETPPTRGYTNLFLLPRPVPALNGNGLARSVALAGGVGKVFLFNHEPGPTGAQRLFARPNALTTNPSTNEKGEGASGVVLTDGTIMFANGGHDGQGAQRVYFYNPYADSWTTLDTGVSRMYGDAVQLPDGTVMLVNGYQGPGEPGNETDISSPVGDIKRPTIVDPYATPRTATNLPAWPEPTHRGYHSIAVLLKDGRVLIGGGKDAGHATGCEKNELRIFEPPYLSAGPRPIVTTPGEGSTMTVAGAPVTILYEGPDPRAVRGAVLVAPGSITHAFDSGQRYVPLSVLSGPALGSLTVAPPSNINVAQPGDYMLFLISDAGVPSVGVHVRLLPPPACLYAVDGNGASYIEAEKRSRQDGPIVEVTDAARSGGKYLQVTEGSGSHQTAPDEGKVLWFDVNVTNGGNFYLWALASGPDTSGDSFWVSVDGGPDTLLTLPAPPAWGWVRLSATPTSIPSGRHTLKVKVREDGARIDRLLLTKDAGLTPAALGPGTSLACNGLPAPTGVGATPGNGQATVAWTAVTGATSYTVKRATTSGGPYMIVQSGITGTSLPVGGLTNGTTYYFVVSATGAPGESPDSLEASATPTAGPAWTSQSIGAVMATGSHTEVAGVFDVRGSGADIYGTADEFHFVHQALTGDGTITARVTSIQNTNVWAKAGVMMRDGTAAGARNVMTLVSPTPANGYRWQRRTATGGSSSSTAGGNGAIPVWLRVTRTGNSFAGFTSSNGTSWTPIGSPVTITMPATIRVGLAVTSHADGTLASGVFDNVSITTPAPPMPPSAPTGLVAMGGPGQAGLVWTDTSNNETSFRIERKPLGDPDTSFVEVGTTGANATSFTNTPVPAGSYTYRVRASNAAGNSGYSNTADATVTAPAGPAAPSNLVATITGGNTANLSWTDNASNETGFRVERKVGAGSYSTLATKAANVTTHADGSLSPNSYTYRVIATGSPDSAPSNEVVVIIANPGADAYVRSGTSAGTNFGTATVLDVKHTNTTTTKRNAFLRFSLAGVAATVTSAKLRLFGNAVTSAKATAVHSVADITWIESGTGGITWNYPTTDAGGPAMSASPLATQTVATTAAYVEWDVTAYVQQQRTAGATALTLGVKSAVLSDEGQTTFNSREGTNKPVLVISSRP